MVWLFILNHFRNIRNSATCHTLWHHFYYILLMQILFRSFLEWTCALCTCTRGFSLEILTLPLHMRNVLRMGQWHWNAEKDSLCVYTLPAETRVSEALQQHKLQTKSAAMTDVISKSVQTLFNNRKTLSQHLVKIITFRLFEVSSIPYLPVCVFSNLRENSV